jgi:hypothetical protein
MSQLQQSSTATLAPGPGLRLPDFLIIGAAKSGTTTLYQYLQRHPDVFMSTPKEMSFFSKDEVYARGFEWYAALFRGAEPGQLCGEASTTYSRWPTYRHAAERIAAAVPHVRMLYVVRNPVERLYSFYGHRMREEVSSSLQEFIDHTPEAVHSGMYMEQLDQFLTYFPREQLKVLFLEDLVERPAELLAEVGQFLNLSPRDYLAEGDLLANAGGGTYYATQRLTQSIQAVKRVPLAHATLRLLPAHRRQQVFRWLQRGPVGQRLKRKHRRSMTPLTPLVRSELYELFRADVERLEAFTHRDLSGWRESSVAPPTRSQSRR